MEDWFTEHKLPLGDWMEAFVDCLNRQRARLSSTSSPPSCGWVIEALTEALLVAPAAGARSPLFAGARLLAAPLAGSSSVVHRAGLPADHQSRLLAGDDGDAVAGHLRHARLRRRSACRSASPPRTGRGSTPRIRPVLDLMQTIPTFVYLIPTLILFGLGVVPGLISTVIFAIPAPIRLTHLGITSVPKPLIEAGEAFGATQAAAALEGRAALRAADHHGRHHPVHHAVACRWW